MVLSSRQLNALHVNSVRGLIGAGIVGTAMTVVAVYNLVAGPRDQDNPAVINKDKEILEDQAMQ